MKNDGKYALNDEYTERHKIKERMKNVMKQTIYEQLGGTYRKENGNLVPDVELPEQKPIGKYGRMHLDYLKQHRRGRYSALLGEGRLNAYLAEIDEQAHDKLISLTVELAKTQGIDEHLKATDQLRWVQLMNNVRSQAEEIVIKEFVLCH